MPPRAGHLSEPWPRAWQLRENLTASDAVYVALVEALDADLVTGDRPLGAAPGHAGRVEVIG